MRPNSALFSTLSGSSKNSEDNNNNGFKSFNRTLTLSLFGLIGKHTLSDEFYFKQVSLIICFIQKGYGYYRLNHSTVFCEEEKKSSQDQPGQFKTSLPTFTEEEVAKHNKDAERIWISYKNGVYDITDFIESHPGYICSVVFFFT
jgi:sulfite oxidase